MPNKFLAAVDMGTNSFHLIVVKVRKDGTFKIIDRERKIIRLGSHRSDGTTIISDEETEQAVKILAGFKKLADFYEAPMKAIATSAVREAMNKDEFVKSATEKTGVNIQVVSGNEEALLIFEGAKAVSDVHDKKSLCIDIGGGSTEFILAHYGKPVFAESVKVGAVRLSKKFFPDFVITDSALKACEEYVEEKIRANNNLKFEDKIDIAVGASGTMQAAAAMIFFLRHQKPKKSLGGFTFYYDELKNISKKVFGCRTTKERLKIEGMESKRADIIPAGLIILNKAFEIFHLHSITISEYALREGIILDMMKADSAD